MMQQATTGNFPAHNNSAFDKKALRHALCASRANLAPDEALTKSRTATHFLLADALWQSARQVALYMSMPHELSTVLLIKEAWAEGKGVWLPRCLPKQPKQPGHMAFARCNSIDALSPGVWGILEPSEQCPVLNPAQDGVPDLLILPAVGLDPQGTRLGYGGGYYDNLLRDPDWAGVPRIGLVFGCQIVPHIPRDPWDQPVGALLCEEGLTWL